MNILSPTLPQVAQTPGAFAQTAEYWWGIGLSPIPVSEKNGVPCVTWGEHQTVQPTLEMIREWIASYPSAGVRLICGWNGKRGLYAVDWDDDRSWPVAQPCLLRPWGLRFGSKGAAALYIVDRPDELPKSATWELPDKRHAADILAHGRLVTVPPTMHLTAKPKRAYVWLDVSAYAWREGPLDLDALSGALAQAGHGRLTVKPAGEGRTGGRTPRRQDRLPPWQCSHSPYRKVALAALDSQRTKVGATPEGDRHNAPYRAGCDLSKFIEVGALTEGEVIAAVEWGCGENGYSETHGDMMTHLENGLTDGAGFALPDLREQPVVAELFSPAGKAGPESAAVWFDDGQLGEPEPELIERLIPDRPGWVILMAGQSGAGKSFIAVVLGAVIAGMFADFLGLKNRCFGPGGVFLVCGEGEGTIRDRLQGFKVAAGVSGRRFPFAMTTACPARGTPWPEVAKLAREAEQQMVRSGQCDRLRLVMVDALASCAGADLDHNDPAAAVSHMQALQQFSLACGAPALVNAHFGKVAESGVAGSHQWRAQADHAIYVLASRNETEGTVTQRRLIVGKSRTGPEGPLFNFDLRSVPLGLNLYGEPRTTCIPVRVDAPTGKSKKSDAALNEAVRETIRTSSIIRPVNVPDLGWRNGQTIEQVRINFSKIYDGSAGAKRVAWADVKKSLLADEHADYVIYNEMIVSRAPDGALGKR